MHALGVVLTGDICPTRGLVADAADVKQTFRLIENADFALGNFEMPLTDQVRAVEKLLNIKADPSIAPTLSELGLDMVTVANNHAVDYGWEGLSQTIDLLRSQGLTVIGAGSNIAEATAPAIATVAGRQIGVLAYSCLLPTGMSAGINRPGIAPIHVQTSYEIDPYYQMEEPGDLSAVRARTQARETDVEAAVAAIRALRNKCDTLIVTIHWGFGSGEDLAEYQLPLAQRLIDAGADIIHGHHPHAVHPIGFYRGKPIFFGLGTLVGQQVFLDAPPAVRALWAEMSPDGYVATISISQSNVLGIELTPTTLNSDRLPLIAKDNDFDRIHHRLVSLSAPYGANIELDGTVLRASAAALDCQRN
ncbi:CapA family protein [Aminobacter sp. P9b]|uniref:CapA family protein n=1 Tax=Aminobacter sp. P9b TaxID=3133697 RepID=UPI003254354E